MTTVRGVALTLVFFALMASAQADQPAIPFEDVTRYWERPPEEDLEPLPSLEPSEREELRERLEALSQLYDAKVWELRAEHYGWTPEYLARRLHYDGRRRLDDWAEVARTLRPPLRPEHDPWVIETAMELVQEDPIDWKTLLTANGILSSVDIGADPVREKLARQILAAPIHPDQPMERVYAANTATIYFARHWPDDAPEILAVIYTLPHQPREREILPVARDARRPAEKERRCAQFADHSLRGRGRKAAAVLERIEASLEAGKYTLDRDSEKRVERLREYARKGSLLRRLLPW